MCGEHSLCSGHTGFAPHRGVCAFPVYTAQAPGCSIWSGPCTDCGSSFRVPHNSADSVAPAFCAFPCLSGSGRQELAGRTLPGAAHLLPSAAPASVSARAGGVRVPCVCSPELASSRDPPCRCGPPRISGSLWLETGGLLQFGRSAVSGAEFPPFPSPLPPASGGDGPVRRQLALLWDCSVPLFCEWLAG